MLQNPNRTIYRRPKPVPTSAPRKHSQEAYTTILLAQDRRCYGCQEELCRERNGTMAYNSETGAPVCILCASCMRLVHKHSAVKLERLADIRILLHPSAT